MLKNFLSRAVGVSRAMSGMPKTSAPFAKAMAVDLATESTEDLITQGLKIMDETCTRPDAKAYEIKATLMFIRAFTIAKTKSEQVYALGALGPLAWASQDHPEIKEAIRKAGIHRKWIEADIIDWPKNPDGTDGRLVLDRGPPLPPPGGASSDSDPQLR